MIVQILVQLLQVRHRISLLTSLHHLTLITNKLENASENADDCISPNSEISQPNSEEINSDTPANSNTETLGPLNEHRSPVSETYLQSVIPDYPVIMEEDNANNSSTGRKVYNIAPGESKLPVSND